MARYTTAIRSPLPADDAFDALADFSSVASWDPGVSRATRVGRGSQPIGVGTAFEVDVTIGPRTVPFRYVITEYDRPRRVVLRAERSGIVSVDTVTVRAEAEGGSTLTYDAVLELRGLLRIADPLLALGFDRVGDKAAAGLRTHLRGVSVATEPAAPAA